MYATRSPMWYASSMPQELPKDAIENADASVAFAQQVRRYHRRRSSTQRGSDISAALERLRQAMAPLRSEIGRFPYGPQTEEAQANRQIIREASAAIQKERRKCWKMKPANEEEK